MIKRLSVCAAMLAATLCNYSHAQLRIVDYNTAGIANQSAMTTVLQAIRDESVNGVSKPIDAILLQELSTGDITTIVSILNAQGNGTYAAGNVGSTTGAGGVGLVYRTETLDLVAQAQVVNTSTAGAARGVMRYTLRPDGYDSSADFYVYNSHYKSSDTTADANRRNVEAAAIRANADALGDGAHAIYVGDFNIYRSSEPMWATLTGAGAGQAFDPVNQIGNWHDGASFRGVHTQNPAGSGGVGGGMDDRFDWQMITGELQDSEGMSIVPGSYHAFGNNNTHTINGHINTGTGATPTVLNALGAATDHLPVVAQYQVPAKMSVAYGATPSRVITGASVNLSATASNTAGDGVVVVTASGADELDYTLSGMGAVSGAFNGTDAAFGGSNVHSLSLNTATAGVKTGGVSAVAISPQVPDPVSNHLLNYEVVDHANPSFSLFNDIDWFAHDFGTVTLGSIAPTFDFQIANLWNTFGFTSDLEHDGFTTVGDTGIFITGLEDLQPAIEAGETSSFIASMSTATVGTFESTIYFYFSDENLLGADNMLTLSVTLTGTIIDEVVTGDFDGDGDVDGRDFLSWQRGESPDPFSSADLELWQSEYAPGPLAASVAVPEPGTMILVLSLGAMSICKRRP